MLGKHSHSFRVKPSSSFSKIEFEDFKLWDELRRVPIKICYYLYIQKILGAFRGLKVCERFLGGNWMTINQLFRTYVSKSMGSSTNDVRGWGWWMMGKRGSIRGKVGWELTCCKKLSQRHVGDVWVGWVSKFKIHHFPAFLADDICESSESSNECLIPV